MNEMYSIAKLIGNLNRQGICTKGTGTFACGCPTCMESMRKSFEEELNKSPL